VEAQASAEAGELTAKPLAPLGDGRRRREPAGMPTRALRPAAAPALAPATRARVGRNDPCPCDSGRKWKACHGATR